MMNNFFIKIGGENFFLFILKIYLISLIPPLISHFIPSASEEYSSLFELGLLPLGFILIFLSPLFETILFQTLPVYFTERKELNAIARQVVIVAPFAIAHIEFSDLLPSLVNGIGGAYILGVCYLVLSRKSHKIAYVATVLVHALHNATIFLIFANITR